MVQVKKFVEELKNKGYEISKGNGRGFVYIKSSGEAERTFIFCSHIWVGSELLCITIIKRSRGYEVKFGELLRERTIGIVHSQREVILKLKQAIGM